MHDTLDNSLTDPRPDANASISQCSCDGTRVGRTRVAPHNLWRLCAECGVECVLLLLLLRIPVPTTGVHPRPHPLQTTPTPTTHHNRRRWRRRRNCHQTAQRGRWNNCHLRYCTASRVLQSQQPRHCCRFPFPFLMQCPVRVAGIHRLRDRARRRWWTRGDVHTRPIPGHWNRASRQMERSCLVRSRCCVV